MMFFLQRAMCVALVCLATTSHAFSKKKPRTLFDKTIDTESSLADDSLQLIVLPNMEVGIEDLLTGTYECKDVSAKSELDIDWFYNNIRIKVTADCPSTVDKFFVTFDLGTRDWYVRKDVSIKVRVITNEGSEVHKIPLLTEEELAEIKDQDN